MRFNVTLAFASQLLAVLAGKFPFPPSSKSLLASAAPQATSTLASDASSNLPATSTQTSAPVETQIGNKRVVYIQENNPAGNSILAMEISPVDGTLSNPVRTATNGTGQILFIIASQGTVAVYGNYLFTTNAGDGTLSFFNIDPEDPLNPKLNDVVLTLGMSPCSVVYSPLLNQVCVANGGGGLPGITCFSVDPVYGLHPIGPQRNIPQPQQDVVNPIGMPAGIPFGDIVFNPSQTAVFITLYNTSAYDPTPNPGYMYTYPVVDGQVSFDPIVTTFDRLTTPFSLNFIGSDEKAFMTNPLHGAPGAAWLDVTPAGGITGYRNVTIPYQVAGCWAAYSPSYESIFVLDGRVSNITQVNSTTGNTVSQVKFNSSSPDFGGATDSLTDGDFLYVLSVPYSEDFHLYFGSPQVLVYDMNPIKDGGVIRQVQSFDIYAETGSGYEYQGLSIWPFDPLEH